MSIEKLASVEAEVITIKCGQLDIHVEYVGGSPRTTIKINGEVIAVKYISLAADWHSGGGIWNVVMRILPGPETKPEEKK